MTLTELGGADRLYRRATIDALPDNALIETFEFYLVYDGLNVHVRVQKAEGAGAVRTTRARSESGRWSEAEAGWGR